jgi:hypothetical protein
MSTLPVVFGRGAAGVVVEDGLWVPETYATRRYS